MDDPKQDQDGHSPADVSKTAEKAVAKGNADPMPPEGTDETVLKGDDAHNPLKQSDRIKATWAIIGKDRY